MLQELIDARLNELFEAKFASGDYVTRITQPGEELAVGADDEAGGRPAFQTRTTTLPDGRIQTKIITVRMADYPDLADMVTEKDSINEQLGD